MTAKDLSKGITRAAKSAVAVYAFAVLLMSMLGFISGHFTLPHQNKKAVAAVVDSVSVLSADVDSVYDALGEVRRVQKAGDEKLDRVLCILEGTPPLTCERRGQ